MTHTTLSSARIEEVEVALGRSTQSESPAPQRTPVHVLYGGAHLFRRGSIAKLGTVARTAMDTWGKDPAVFAKIVGLDDSSFTHELWQRVSEKLERYPIEKLCIDFEDGYGLRSDEEEDAEAVRAASDLACEDATPQSIVGIRIKALTTPTIKRSIRTLDLFLTTLAKTKGGELPVHFTVTLPKVSHPREVSALANLLMELERALGIENRGTRVGIELMIETPRALVDEDGRIALPALTVAAENRCVAVHLGAYDLTASLNVTAGEQSLDHPACTTARLLMKFALAGSAITVVDGATTILPIARHRETVGRSLSDAQRLQNANDVHSAWQLHASAVRRALALGIYQGWDLHPAQLPARYGAIYAFFLAERKAMAARLRAFVEKATKAMRSGQVFDDAATGQGLLEFFIRGIECGALDVDDVKSTGLSIDDLRSRSFARILESVAK